MQDEVTIHTSHCSVKHSNSQFELIHWFNVTTVEMDIPVRPQ